MGSTARSLTLSSYAAMFFLGVALTVIGAVARSVGLSAFAIGMLVAAQHAGFIVSVLVTGAYCDAFAKPKILFAGSAALAAAFFTFHVSEALWINMIVMAIAGAGGGRVRGHQ